MAELSGGKPGLAGFHHSMVELHRLLIKLNMRQVTTASFIVHNIFSPLMRARTFSIHFDGVYDMFSGSLRRHSPQI